MILPNDALALRWMGGSVTWIHWTSWWYLFVHTCYTLAKSQVLQSLSPLHHYLFCERKMSMNRGLLLWASWPFGSPKSRGRQGTNCVLLIHSPTRGPPSRRSIVDTEKIKVRPFNIDVSSPCFGIKYFVKIIIHIYKHVHLLYLYHRLRCIGYTDILYVYMYMQVSTWRSRPVQISTPCALLPWSIFVWNIKPSPSLDFIKRPSPNPTVRREILLGVENPGELLSIDGHQRWLCLRARTAMMDTGVLLLCMCMYVCMNIKFAVFFGRRFLPPLLQEWLRIEYNHIGFQTPHSFPGSTVPPLQEPFLLAFPVVHWLRSPLPAEQWLWMWIVQGSKIPWYLGLAFWKPRSAHINYIDIEWCVL